MEVLCYFVIQDSPLLLLAQLLTQNINELLPMCPTHSNDPVHSNKLKLEVKEIFLR
jgi:hypothetical protein